MAPFEKIAEMLPEPVKTLVMIIAEKFPQGYFSNYIVFGIYPPNAQVVMNAWSIVGFIPGVHGLVEVHGTAGNTESEKFRWLAKLRQVIPVISLSQDINLPHSLFCGMTHGRLGAREPHVLGMVSLHQAVESGEECIALWCHPELSREVVEYLIKPVLETRLQS